MAEAGKGLRAVLARAFGPSDVAEWRAGWRVVAGAAVGLGTGVSLYLMVSSLFIVRITAEFGWSRGDMGIAGAVAFVVGAVSLSFTGKIVDRVGFRPVVLVCAPAMALLYLVIALQPGSFPFYLAMMVWGGIAGAGTGAIAYTRPVIGAFRRQRGLALGVATAGVSVTSIAISPLLAQVIAVGGWRAGLYALAAITLLIGLPLALYLIASARGGARVRTHAATTAAAAEEAPAFAGPAVPDVAVGAAMRSAPFWLIVTALVAVNVPGAGVVGQLAPLVGDKGLSEVATGFVMSIYAVGLLFGRLVTGFALDRTSPALVAAVMTVVPAIGMALLLIPTPSFALAAVAVGLIGIQQGSEVDLIAYFVSRRFGLAHYGAVYGRVATFGAVGTAIGLVLFGQMHDATGTYDLALIVGGVAFLIGAAAFAGLDEGGGRGGGFLRFRPARVART